MERGCGETIVDLTSASQLSRASLDVAWRLFEVTLSLIAFTTLALMRAPYGDPQVQGFFDRMASVFAAAEGSEGFIARSVRDDRTGRHSWGEMVHPRFVMPEQHAHIARTLSLWSSVESVQEFTYRGAHGQAFLDRADWFNPMAWPTHAAWWVPDDHVPDWREAAERIEHLHEHGPTAFAFTFARAFGAGGNAF